MRKSALSRQIRYTFFRICVNYFPWHPTWFRNPRVLWWVPLSNSHTCTSVQYNITYFPTGMCKRGEGHCIYVCSRRHGGGRNLRKIFKCNNVELAQQIRKNEEVAIFLRAQRLMADTRHAKQDDFRRPLLQKELCPSQVVPLSIGHHQPAAAAEPKGILGDEWAT